MSDSINRDIRLKQVYSQLDRKFEEEETQREALKNKIPYLNLYGFPVDPAVLGLIQKSQAEAARAVCFYREGSNLKLGIVAPSQALDDLIRDLKAKNYVVEKHQISGSSFRHLLESYEKVVVTEHHDDNINLATADSVSGLTTMKELAEKFSGVSATQLIDLIMGTALSLSSSDVHVEPEEQGVKLRFRIDGVLQDAASLPIASHHTLVSRIKILSKLKLNLTTVPQDGSFHMVYNNQPIDIRVSILPSAFGESIVMRILRQDNQNLKFEELGIGGLAYEKLKLELAKPNGMVLTTGPTGSGKTTTLYAILSKLNEPGTKIITLEDPVEYRIPGITQTPIDSAAGMTFGSGLRAILRQDPDVIMVGEMRDLETAETAAQAALTGHIVLSTLHTNDAASAIPRLLDLGIKPFILAPAINAIIAQRLVRKICPSCKTEDKLDQSSQQRVEMVLGAIPKSAKIELPKIMKFYHSTGCKACNGLGYKDRIGVYEIFTVNDAIEKLIHEQSTNSEIRNQAIADGMVTMAQDGLLKALSGITDIAEVFRVTEA